MNLNTGKPKDIGLDVIQKEVKRLQDRATTLQSKAIVRMDANVEKAGSEVEIIKISTQSIERIMIEELRPAVNETRSLVREIRWKMDVYAKATRSDIQMNGVGTRKPKPYGEILLAPISSSNGIRIRKPKPHVDPMGSFHIFGRCGNFTEVDIGEFKEDLIGPMIELTRQMNNISPKQWEKVNRPLGLAMAFFSKGVFEILQGLRERPASYEYILNSSMSQNKRITMQLDWFPQGKAPMHYDLSMITDIQS